MNIPQELFEDFPIEYKKINPIDFSTALSERNIEEEGVGFQTELTILEVDEYLNEPLNNALDLDEKNTVVINASVGQGKSYAIIQTIKRYYEAEEEYLIFVASPFVSLVKQYCEDIHKDAGIPKEQIYNYDNLGRNEEVDYWNRAVQVVTVNTLLGNPGENGFKNSDKKRTYLNSLVSKCERNNIKVVFIYDEIHDSYYNFKEEYIFNLWKWKNVIHKNFVLSATYNEASKVVIEYLAELTEKKIRIFESPRNRILEKQSDLYLHYSRHHRFTETTPEIYFTIKSIIDRKKNLDILCYSKSLAKKIIDTKGEIGQLLKDAYGEVKDCTSELSDNIREENEDPKNQFDNSKCNVGTNFKTGVSIRKENHSFLIILPPRATRQDFKNYSGIFSGGINSIIQALARQRKKGEIHIVLPYADSFKYSSLRDAGLNAEQISEFETYYNLIKHYEEPEDEVLYTPFTKQGLLLHRFYLDKLKGNVDSEIEKVNESERNLMPRLNFPTFKTFKLHSGEDYLASEHKFFGADLSAYVTYASFTNQFINCRLKEFYFQLVCILNEGKIVRDLNLYFTECVGEDYYHSFIKYSNFQFAYHNLRNYFFKNFSLRLKKAGKDKTIKLNPYSEKSFEIGFLKFVSQFFYRRDVRDLDDFEYTRSTYFLDSITSLDSFEIDSNTNITDLSDYERRRRLFQIINHFRHKLNESIQTVNENGFSYTYLRRTMPDDFLSIEDKRYFKELEILIKSDKLLENEVFDFNRRLTMKSLYKKLIEDFFETEVYRTPESIDGRRPNVRKIISVKESIQETSILNLVGKQDYNIPNEAVK